MSAPTVATTPEAERFSPAAVLRRLGRGELGSIRVLLGIAVIWTIFQIANDRFLSAVNLSNLTLQIAAVATISIGVVLVLLLGEIDLSVGAVSVNEGLAPVLALVAGLLVGTAIGLFNGFFVTVFGIPSFVVTLAGLLGWQGMQLLVLGETGSINLPPSIITDLTTTFFEPAVGWLVCHPPASFWPDADESAPGSRPSRWRRPWFGSGSSRPRSSPRCWS